jgi:hypothetical protein
MRSGSGSDLTVRRFLNECRAGKKGFTSPARIMAGSAGLLADLIGQKKSTQWALLSKKFYILKI